MARLIIDTGIQGNPATGDSLRTAMTKANTNFSELYTDLAATTSSNGNLTNEDTNGDVKIFANGTGIVEIDRLSINNTAISSLDTNADITLTANGTGNIIVGALKVNGTTISSDDSTKISIAEAVDVNGHLTVTGTQVDFTALPTSDPGVAGRLFRSGNDVKISTG